MTINVSARDDSSSLLPITKMQTSIYPGTQQVRSETVKVRRLDQLVSPSSIRPSALLKIDVQGYELQVLNGCINLIGLMQYVYVECSSIEFYESQALHCQVNEWLTERGFVLRSYHNPSYVNNVLAQADYLYERAVISS
ncbi:MAG: Methyltransferase FkbM [Ramlibacter sp.]|nr:Methyltransferase FkbM [Ramlibacter sp.]